LNLYLNEKDILPSNGGLIWTPTAWTLQKLKKTETKHETHVYGRSKYYFSFLHVKSLYIDWSDILPSIGGLIWTLAALILQKLRITAENHETHIYIRTEDYSPFLYAKSAAKMTKLTSYLYIFALLFLSMIVG
jgi:hypothetical protein